MGTTNVDVTIRNPADPGSSWTGKFRPTPSHDRFGAALDRYMILPARQVPVNPSGIRADRRRNRGKSAAGRG